MLCANCSDESTTCMGVVSSIYACCSPFYIYLCYTSFSCLCSSHSFQSYSFNSCNSFTISSILCFSLCLCMIHLLCCYLFMPIAKAGFLHKWVCSKLAALFCLYAIDNFYVASIVHSYVYLFCCSWCSHGCLFANHSKTMLTNPSGLEKLWQYLHGSSSPQWYTLQINGNCTLMHLSYTKKCGPYSLKLLVPKVNFLNSSISTFAFLIFYISYNPIRNGRVGQGAFFFWWILANSPVEVWYDTSSTMSLSVENFNKTYGGFSTLYIHMKVPKSEAYQSDISISASIVSFDMHGGSF